MKFITTILLAGFASAVMAIPTTSSPNCIAHQQSKATLTTAKRSGPPIINDDFEGARAEANKRKLPLFVEVWAPW